MKENIGGVATAGGAKEDQGLVAGEPPKEAPEKPLLLPAPKLNLVDGAAGENPPKELLVELFTTPNLKPAFDAAS